MKTQDMTICPKCGHMIVPSRGRPDYLCCLGTYGFAIEVKASELSFPFSAFKEKQRRWAEWWTSELRGHYYLWLCMGKRVNDKEFPRRTWLIPLGYFLTVEKDITQYQKSIPYRAVKGHMKVLQAHHLDAVHLLAPYELEWQGKGVWLPTEKHPIRSRIDSSILSDQEECPCMN